jgi:hypothetical protein
MVRRSFLQAVALSAAAGAGPNVAAKTRYYTIETFFLQNGDQAGRLNRFVTEGYLPAARRTHSGPVIFLEAVAAAHVPQFVMIMGFGTAAEAVSLYTRLHQQEGYSEAVVSWENAPNPPYDYTSLSLLEATDYSPEISNSGPGAAPRVFELRTCHSPTWRQWGALSERFSSAEIPVFHRCGIHPLFYASTVYGPNLPSLTYLIPFTDLSARERAWDKFATDPEWIRLRKESTSAHGQMVSSMQISLFKALPYSPVR